MSSTITCGIDIGAESTKVVLGPARNCEIVRNDVAGHTTPTALSFTLEGARQLGATANLKASNVVTHMNRFLQGEMAENDELAAFYKVQIDSANGTISIPNPSPEEPSCSLSASAILAMLLGKLSKNVEDTITRMDGSPVGSTPAPKVEYALSIGTDMETKALEQLQDAAFAASLENTELVDTSHCYGATYYRKFSGEVSDETRVLVVDVGHTSTHVVVLGFEKAEFVSNDGEETDKAEAALRPVVLYSARNKALGAGFVDLALWRHFCKHMPALAGLSQASRGGMRLLDGCRKLKHLLSQLPEGSVVVENIGPNDTDVPCQASREILAELCNDFVSTLKQMIAIAIENSGSPITSVEVVGGGCRIPFVKDAILESADSVKVLSYSFDDTSVALGAALLRSNDPLDPSFTAVPQAEGTRLESRNAMREEEQKMSNRDNDIELRAGARNQAEALVLELRSARHGNHGNLLPQGLGEYLDEIDNWLFSEAGDAATKDEMVAKLEDVKTTIREMCKDYFRALESEAAAKEADMEAEAKKAQLEQKQNGDDDDDDHDTRRLPKKRRMEMVMKNKAEANELFSDGNFKFAAARYAKALTHCSKFVDLSPDDIVEVNSVKLSLNLNLALAYLKLEKPDQALRVCNDALGIDASSAKALYRRASVYYEKKNWDAAKQDAKRALEIAPDDKALTKLLDRIEAQIKRQKQKEKKMAQKMFG